MYNKSIEQINRLDRNSLEQYLIAQKSHPPSNERTFNIGYTLLKLERLEEAYNYLNELFGDDIEKIPILLTGYYKDSHGNWHDYDDSCDCESNDCGDCGSLLCLGFCSYSVYDEYCSNGVCR